MTDKSKLFLACLGLGMASYIGAAAAADAVLFKIHDVVPVKNADGNVVSCDLGATFYNRTGAEISNAALNLVWADEVVADAINQEERNVKEAQRSGSRRNLPRYNTATYNSRNVTLSLRLPSIKPYQQVTLKSKVATDRCFLLLNDMEINVTNCGTAGDSGKSGTIKNNCNNLFRFIGPKSAEYYSEFKSVSVDEQAVAEQNQMDQRKQEINTMYRDTISAANSLADKLKNSRPDTSAQN